jgi:DNA repair exonuclease SbcCD ATPase subunit
MGLRIRLWIGCLSGAVLSAIAIAVLLARVPAPNAPSTSEFVWVWLPAILGAAVGISFALALWLDRGIVRHLRGLKRGLEQGQVAELRGLPSVSGWGELSDLTMQVQAVLTRQRQLARAAAELQHVSDRQLRIRDGLARWSAGEAWAPLAPESGTLGPLIAILNREMPRLARVQSSVLESATSLDRDLHAALEEAREVAEQAERGFVEATALLTTVRELERLGGELSSTVSTPRSAAREEAAAAREAFERFRDAAASAIESLVAASSESVSLLAGGMMHVQEIAEQTQLISNRATLIALHALNPDIGSARGTAESRSEELKTLTREVREASDRVAALTADIEREVAAARLRMDEARSVVAAALEPIALPPAPAAEAEVVVDSARLMERVREMIQDATAKGERLSSAGERASRAAERLKRRIEGESVAVEAMTAAWIERFDPSIAPPAPPSNPPAMLRVLGRDDTSASPPPARGHGERT